MSPRHGGDRAHCGWPRIIDKRVRLTYSSARVPTSQCAAMLLQIAASVSSKAPPMPLTCCTMASSCFSSCGRTSATGKVSEAEMCWNACTHDTTRSSSQQPRAQQAWHLAKQHESGHTHTHPSRCRLPRHTDRQTDRQTDGQAGRQTGRQTGRQIRRTSVPQK